MVSNTNNLRKQTDIKHQSYLLNMYTATTNREKALKAAAAAKRAIERWGCCKSQFKFKCFSCGEFINRGDKITKCHRATNGMTLRYRGADYMNGLTMAEIAFYQGESGKDMWVHIGCNPCYWDKGFDDGDEIWTPGLRVMQTGWRLKVAREFDMDYETTGRSHWNNFRERKGYPHEKFMRNRIINSVIKFQALWRGYIYKKPKNYPGTSARYALYQEMRRNAPDIGDHVEILFNAKESSESVYSGEVEEVQYRGNWMKIKVKFHYDGEVRKYTGKKFNLLKKECEEHKRKLGIEAKLTGRLNTARIGLMNAVRCQTRPSIRD